MNEVINLLKSHKSVRKYKEKDIEQEKIVSIIQAAQSASTSSFIQAYTIISVEDKEKRVKIAKLAGDQTYIEECPLFLVFCADLNRHKIACEMNGAEIKEGYTESFIIATVDTALAAQNAMVAAESLELGGVYIGGIRNNPDEISELLNIPTNVYPLFGMCLGYPDEDNDIKERLPMEIVFKKDSYTTEEDIEKLKEYDERIKNYYLDRTKGIRADTWTGMMARMMSHIPRPHMKAFLEKHGFFMK
ncbi:NADPH-dependent oxidoreductase [Clostridium zeae]|uniref:NADPH-dependent oxidoreductase n=1 Tax=Clostridium zeae TaxID=2759022 RepID=A0ABQ1E9T6_9CLOT|nr:oxygen-insensitive NADPH nitroreductase [Clostridium zeae]GFZ31498.1 NADPH-dependent oxidoreductase [Clostridium zeae]